ncbi:uncharacterized protein LOC107010231 isoform X3 [Solanum pennellii]|uniref:Uncharacterized protein LOC107010231 isoform X3 n=1 Tax=Solanum pennellii TaxID=28526 RepID=A0ABM1V3D2_SOLPN|nr:uncharacterized protein LOC107010231 isoform X3 [Solanum pennellii]
MRMSSYISALVLWFQGFITQMIKCFKLIVSPTLIARGIDLDQTICNFLLMLQSVLNNHYDGSMNFMHRDELTTSLQAVAVDIQEMHIEVDLNPTQVFFQTFVLLKFLTVINQNENNFNQAGKMYRKFTPDSPMLSEMGELSESMRLFGAQFGQGSLVSTISDQNPKPFKRRKEKFDNSLLLDFLGILACILFFRKIKNLLFEVTLLFLDAYTKKSKEYIGIRNVKEVQEIYSF